MGSASSRAIVDAACSEEMGPNPTLEQLKELIVTHARGRSARVTSRGRQGQRRLMVLAEKPRGVIEGLEGQVFGMWTSLPTRSIRPVEVPTVSEFEAAFVRLGYKQHLAHFAITGSTAKDRLSLLSASLSRRNAHKGDPDMISTSVTTAAGTHRFTSLDHPVVFHLIPTLEKLSVPGWQFFKDKGFYFFDAFLVLLDQEGSFTKSDLAILEGCAHFDIPSYIVCAGKHTDRLLVALFPDGSRSQRVKIGQNSALWQNARSHYMRPTKEAVEEALKDAGLPAQPVYFVEEFVLHAVINGSGTQVGSGEAKLPRGNFHEWELLGDICEDVRRRRVLNFDSSSVAEVTPLLKSRD
ncbi:uncharacterized protein B0H18DRAFT_1033859 [Fomitopsis serialis]|uniref:uncharacterized protein n=1 Tax=Fomitopsis serialis TaxID=139415 RepID=UPI0020088557|nr:uncharacterized protein B0H18DRAFT_1033859 [Neoantrodia serialis]KAH9917593.1 hypothetical protein B0H18DRAFT_1033859 [Neoantrodia serialis]